LPTSNSQVVELGRRAFGRWKLTAALRSPQLPTSNSQGVELGSWALVRWKLTAAVLSPQTPNSQVVELGSWELEVGRCQPLHSPLEREAEANLSDTLLGLLEVAREARRLHEVRVRRASYEANGLGHAGEHALEDRGVDRVEQVEHFGDRLDVRAAGEMERLRRPQVELRERRPAAAVDRRARADVLELRDAVAVEPVERHRALLEVVEPAVAVQILAFPEVDRQRGPIDEDRRDADAGRQLHRGARGDAMPRVGAAVGAEHARIVERVGGVLHVARVELVACRADR